MKNILLFFIFSSFAFSGIAQDTFKISISQNAIDIQWYVALHQSTDFNPISGANDTIYETDQPGIYYATYTLGKCKNASEYFVLKYENVIFEFEVPLNEDVTLNNIQWYNAQNSISGETSNKLNITAEGDYWAQAGPSNCLINTPMFKVRNLPDPMPEANNDTFVMVTTPGSDNVITGNVVTGGGSGAGDDDPAGTISTITILDSTTKGSISIDDDGNFTYTFNGKSSGTDSFTYILCNTNDLCDTATVSIDNGYIDAIDDLYETDVTGDDKVIEVDGNVITDPNMIGDNNDIVPDDASKYSYSVVLVVDGTKGDVTLDEDGKFSYISTDLSFIGLDSFIYAVCVNDVCDTATVYMEFSCRERLTKENLTVPTLLSPNNDGNNDLWVIPELFSQRLCYDSNEVIIFNRWEVKVFHKLNYGMDEIWWDGTSDGAVQKGADKLPSGTYYYIIKMNDDWSNAITGFIHIQY